MIFVSYMVVTIMLVIFTLLPMLHYEAWWIRGWDFPRLQLFAVALILLLIGLAVFSLTRPSSWAMLAAVFFCLVYHAWWIIPYTRLYPVEVLSSRNSDESQTIRIISSNVLTPNRNAQGLIDLVRINAPDILVTLETNLWWQEQLNVLETDYPYTIKCPLDNLYGMHVYSKYPLTESEIKYLLDPELPSIHTLVTLPSGQKVRVHFLHPAPPSPTEKEDSSERDAEIIIVAKSVADSDLPVIVTGDLNDVAWSVTTRLFRKISGLLDPRVGRGMFNTFHADYWFLRWPLDHLFHSKHFTVKNIRVLPSIGSDHFPLFAELVFEQERKDQQNGISADSDDADLAEEKMEDEGVSKKNVPQPGE